MQHLPEENQALTGKDRGLILHIEQMALFDGEGIRTVIFLMGCPLRCRWCSTPQSQKMKPQLGYDPLRCQGCFSCLEACPHGAISRDGGKVKTDPAKCRLCFECVKACPHGARRGYGRLETLEHLVREIEKDEVFFYHSGGGVTLSGGEPLAQVDFAESILRACRERGIHTAMETSGQVTWESFERVLPLLDAVYVDIKHSGPEEHRQLTGVDNRLILDNIRKIDQSPYPVDLFIRLPLVPGCNDDRENLARTAGICKSLKKFKEIHILPYHRLGVESYRFLNRQYELEQLPSLEPEAAEAAAELMRGLGVKVKIGG